MSCCAQYLWLVIAGGVFAFAAAFGIGANDCANCFATSVGSRALTLRQALVCAAIFEFSGAVLLGANVASTIRGGLIEVELFEGNPELLMLGMACVCLSTSIWLITATMLGLPVSTTHSVIGGVIGFSVVAKGFGSVQWNGLLFIVASWFVSPLCSGLLAVTFFGTLRHFVLRSADSLARALHTYPLIVGFTIAVNCYYIAYYGPALRRFLPPQWVGMLAALGVGALLSLVIQLTFINCWLKPKMLAALSDPILGKDQDRRPRRDSESKLADHRPGNHEVGVHGGDDDELPEQGRMDTHQSLRDRSSSVAKMHAAAEVYPAQTEHVFNYLQVFTACAGAFGHGANDVSNAVAPFATVFGLYVTGVVEAEEPVPTWLLAFGGLGIVIGLACLGYKVIKSIGVDMIKVTPARGFTIELSSATIVILGSVLGIPLSTTHCQVGATVGVGMLEGAKSGVNWRLFLKVGCAWLFTIVVTGSLSGALYAWTVFSPSLSGYEGTRDPSAEL